MSYMVQCSTTKMYLATGNRLTADVQTGRMFTFAKRAALAANKANKVFGAIQFNVVKLH